MSDSAKIGKRIQTYREKLAMSVEDLSERTGLPASLINDIEAGHVSPAIRGYGETFSRSWATGRHLYG